MYKPVVHKDGSLMIPRWCFEDTGIKYSKIDAKSYYCDTDYDEYHNLRRISYFACNWYKYLLSHNVLTIPSILKESTVSELQQDLGELMTKYPEYKFVRLCGSSPKDVSDTCIFSDPIEAVNALLSSERTLAIIKNYNHVHLFVRKVQDIKIECRCIIHERKLRAVSVYQYLALESREEYETMIIDFMELYGPVLPYNSCILELGLEDEEGFPFVIEFNSFGIDGFAGAGLFDWDDEKEILYNSIIPEFRYPPEFSF